MKLLLKIFLGLIILIIAALIGVYFYLGTIVKKGIEQFVPPVVGTDVTVGSVIIEPLGGHVAIYDLMVANPDGFTIPHVFSLGKIEIKVDVKSVFSNKIVVKEIEIEKPMASIEAGKTGINLMIINDNINHYLNTGKSVETAPKKEVKKSTDQKAASKQVVIKKLKFDDGEIDLGAFGANMMVPLPDIEKYHIGENKKQGIGQTIAEILSIFTTESLKAYSKVALEQGKKFLNTAKDIAVDKGAAELNKGIGKGLDKIGRLFQ